MWDTPVASIALPSCGMRLDRLADHVVAPQQLAWQGARALVVRKGHGAIDKSECSGPPQDCQCLCGACARTSSREEAFHPPSHAVECAHTLAPLRPSYCCVDPGHELGVQDTAGFCRNALTELGPIFHP